MHCPVGGSGILWDTKIFTHLGIKGFYQVRKIWIVCHLNQLFMVVECCKRQLHYCSTVWLLGTNFQNSCTFGTAPYGRYYQITIEPAMLISSTGIVSKKLWFCELMLSHFFQLIWLKNLYYNHKKRLLNWHQEAQVSNVPLKLVKSMRFVSGRVNMYSWTPIMIL